MVMIPIIRGVYADSVADFIESLPINREPVVLNTGLSEGYLRAAPGIGALGTGPGADRGGVNWNGTCYRVMGTKLVTVSQAGAVTILGDVGAGGQCSFDYSFDRLAIASGGRLYYWNGALTQVTDPDLGAALDVIWIDGYFMTTDGEFLVVTELNDPTAVDPIKYGSSEEDPDPVTGLLKIRGEVYALNRHTIEVFQNIGGNGFPFQRNGGAQIPRGCVGTHAKALFLQTFAFVGSSRNEALGVYLAGGGNTVKISSIQVDKLLNALSPDEQAGIVVEARTDENEQRLLVHLPDKTLVYFSQASQRGEADIWAIYASGVTADEAYRGRNGVQCYGRYIVGDKAGNVGQIDGSVPTQFGDITGWRFDTALLYNENGRGILNSVELTGLPGRGIPGSDPRAFLSMTVDGVQWSQERAIATGRPGQRNVHMQWRPKMRFNQWIGMRFRGADGGMEAFARLDAKVEPLSG